MCLLTGTKTSDTICVDCPNGFYSPSGLNCIKWTKLVKYYLYFLPYLHFNLLLIVYFFLSCSARNEIETEHGSSVKDVTCTPKRRERYGLIFAIVLTILFHIILYFAQQSTSKYMQDSSVF